MEKIISYREEGALVINEIFPGFDARIYASVEEFDPKHYPMKRGDRLMIRPSGSNNPMEVNPDRIVKNAGDVIAFMKRWENTAYRRCIVQRYPNEKLIEHSAAGSILYTDLSLTIEIKEMPMEFLRLNMTTDTRETTSREFKPIVTLRYPNLGRVPRILPGGVLRPVTDDFKENVLKPLKTSIYKLWKFGKDVDEYFIRRYPKGKIMPTFLAVVLKNRNIFPVDVKRKMN